MIIITQNKETIINFDNFNEVALDERRNEKAIYAFSEQSYEVLGEYESKERSKEVLQEVVNEYRKVARVDSRQTKATAFYIVPRVYEMPEK